MEKNTTVDEEDLKKLYITYNFMDSVIKKIVSYCPNLRNVATRSNQKRKLIKKALNEIDWHGLENEIYDTLESKGDMFFEIYFEDEDDKIPRLRVLEPKNMLRALLDDKNRYKQYVYREWVEDESPDYSTGAVYTSSQRERVIVFERGRKIVFDPKKNDKNEYIKDKDNNIVYNVEEIPNRDSYKNEFPLIHIKGYKKQKEEFSENPAEKYIDMCLTLDQITSDFRQINRMLGYPFIMIVDGEPIKGHKRSPASIMGVKTSDSIPEGKQAIIKDIQINNDLKSLFEEFKIVRDDLYDKAGLVTPTLREKLNVDSSRVVQQLNLPSENKIELYVDNIIKEMILWFEILLKENNLYNERTDIDLSFIKPKFIIKSSPFDELLYEQSEIKSTKKSRQEIYIENGNTDEEIEIRKKEINDELGDEAKDKSFTKENEIIDKVSNANNVDKNMIK